MFIKPLRLASGDAIGILAPSYALSEEWTKIPKEALEQKGFRVVAAPHAFSVANEYAGTVEERASDFNAMIADESVKMLLFGGGEVCNELLPYLDYEAIARTPKIICSYSDSTTLLNAIHYRTGLATFYGASLRTFDQLKEYNWRSFAQRLMTGSLEYEPSGPWNTLCGGACEGRLIGGYLPNFALLQNTDYFRMDHQEGHILFLEDHIKFSSPAVISKYLSHLEQCGVFGSVVGVIFGHYSEENQPIVREILMRTGNRHGIPVVMTDDFGHGQYNTILPIGVKARLDADRQTLGFLESGVC